VLVEARIHGVSGTIGLDDPVVYEAVAGRAQQVAVPQPPLPVAVYSYKDQDTVTMNVRAQRNF
jgi:hypothetical protein